MINLEDYLAVVAAYIRRDGYVKSAYQDPTWEKALIRYETPIKSDNIAVTRDDKQLAKDAIMYFFDQEKTDNDYVNKVKAILSKVIKQGKDLEKRDLPFIASAVQSYLKNEERVKRRKEAEDQRRQEAVRSSYVGEIGDKITHKRWNLDK